MNKMIFVTRCARATLRTSLFPKHDNDLTDEKGNIIILLLKGKTAKSGLIY